MQFKLDENLPDDLIAVLAQHGHNAMTAEAQGLAGKSDDVIADVVQAERRCLVTLDLDFANIRQYVPELYSGIIVLRTRLQSRDRILKIFKPVLDLLATENPVGKLWIVEDAGIRVR